MSTGLATHGYVEEGSGVRFVMRAFKTTPTTGYVYWATIGAPDPTGAGSPYDPGDLVDIVIARRENT